MHDLGVRLRMAWRASISSRCGALFGELHDDAGAADLVLAPEWRMMGAVEAGDGMLLFGISTAFLFYVMLHVWRDETQA